MKFMKCLKSLIVILIFISLTFLFGKKGFSETDELKKLTKFEQMEVEKEYLNMNNGINLNSHSSVYTFQSGDENISRVDQLGEEDLIYIHQFGNRNKAYAGQEGDKNLIIETQVGDDNDIWILQIGSQNEVLSFQYGTNLKYKLIQKGNGKRLIIIQFNQ